MSFLTVVVDMILLLRRKSASCPPIGTIIVITMWGTADRIPTCWEFTQSGENKINEYCDEQSVFMNIYIYIYIPFVSYIALVTL